MSGTLGRIRFYLWCDLSTLTVDYAPPLADYPEYPRKEPMDIYRDRYKSALGSNFWIYHRGTSGYIAYNWVEVSDDCAATMGVICGSAIPYSPHISIYEGNGIDGIAIGSLFATGTQHLKGTYFYDGEAWDPLGVNYGLWNFTTEFRREA